MKIVLLEPDKILADTYRQAFVNEGHKVTMCATSQAAIFAVDDEYPDVVVLEFQLTGHSGIEFLYEFRSYQEWADIPVIALTNVPAESFSGSWELLRNQLGVAAYHYKPLTTLRVILNSIKQLGTTV